MPEEVCPHGKTLDEECDECEAIYEASGIERLLDYFEQEGHTPDLKQEERD